MIIAYADPPYPGQAKRRYGREEIDSAALLEELDSGDYEGWALSTSSVALPDILRRTKVNEFRVMAWVKPFAIFKPGVNPAYAWEPILVKPARKLPRSVTTVRDWVSCNITLKRGLCGAKPDGFCEWLFTVLGMSPEDNFIDMFPGTGAVSRAWETWRTRREKGR